MFLENFFFPKFTWKFLLRIAVSAVILFCAGYFFFMPCFINGASMKPTYDAIGFNFCNKLRYLKNSPSYGNIVILRYVGRKYFLKRVVALENDTVEFRNGQLFRNGIAVVEDYVKLPCRWNMPPVTVRKNMIFVVGDNRSMPIEEHQFGMISIKRVEGAPLW